MDSQLTLRMRNKTVAAILAFIMGIFGVHRFYLGQRVLGILHFFMFFITFMITVSEPVEFPPIIIPFLIGFVDAVLLFVMPQVEFDDKLLIDGKLEGKIRTQGRIEVTSHAQVKADIEVKDISVSGQLQGNLVASNSVHITGQGKHQGDISCKTLQIDRGGVHNGTTVMN